MEPVHGGSVRATHRQGQPSGRRDRLQLRRQETVSFGSGAYCLQHAGSRQQNTPMAALSGLGARDLQAVLRRSPSEQEVQVQEPTFHHGRHRHLAVPFPVSVGRVQNQKRSRQDARSS